MSSIKKAIAILLVSLLVFGGLLFSAIKYHFSGMDLLSSCDEEIVRELVSPNKKEVATIYIRNCGATTDYVTHVNLRRADSQFKLDDNRIFSAGEVWASTGKLAVNLFWRDNSNLEIVVPNVQESEAIWDEVNVRVRSGP